MNLLLIKLIDYRTLIIILLYRVVHKKIYSTAHAILFILLSLHSSSIADLFFHQSTSKILIKCYYLIIQYIIY